MRIKRNKYYIFLIFTLLTSCVPNGNNHIPTTKADISIQNVPDLEEFKRLDNGERFELKSKMEQIPLASCEEYFTNEIEAFLNEYENVKLKDVTLKKDDLSVVADKNKKSFRNLNFEINIIIDTSNNVGSNDFAIEISGQLRDFMERYSYFVSKASELNINSFDLHHTKFYNLGCDYNTANESMFIEQPEDEYAVQTLAFDFTKRNADFTLRKFGVIPESRELYVEYYVRDDYFDYNNMESSITDLEKVSNDIKEFLMSQQAAMDFALSKDVNLLTVSFYSGNLDDSYVTFHFEL